MREVVLAWYGYPFPDGTVYFARHLTDASIAMQVFAHATGSAARITPEGWQFLWNFYGIDGLTGIARATECYEGMTDEEIADQLVKLSMLAGYDPVSGFFGTYCEAENSFELAGR